jgi:DNA-binding MarR family transcriptional regulator
MLAWRALLGTYISLRERLSEELESERGLPLTWYELLLRLYYAPGQQLRMQDLAAEAFLSKSGLTQAVTAMEEAGLVTRQPVPGDRRGTYAAITAAGRRVFRRAAPVHLRGLQEHFGAHLTAEEARSMVSGLNRVGQEVIGEARWRAWGSEALVPGARA